jgi:hypothetical protein
MINYAELRRWMRLNLDGESAPLSHAREKPTITGDVIQEPARAGDRGDRRAELIARCRKYRDEARALRRDAEFLHDPELRLQFRDIAAQYERLAASIEAMRKDSERPG